MNELPAASPPSFLRRLSPVQMALIALVVVSVFRLWYSTRLELVPDEAYYWLWSKNLAASYRDKGPAIAWTIALGTRLFGDTPFGIRFFAVLLGAGTGWQLFRLARRLFDDRAGLWCLLLAAIMPLFAIGSILMTIDALSVFFWAWAANVFWTALESRKVSHWTALGFLIGLGFLAKFTNGVQLACIGLFLVWSKPHRALLVSRQTLAMSAAFLVAILPILWWNFQTGWVHAGALQSRSGVEDSFQIRPGEFLQFVGGELGVISPLLAIGIVVAAVGTLWKEHRDARMQFLLSQSLPLAGIFLFFSLNKAGKENWTAPALVTGLILTVIYWRNLVVRVPRWRWAVQAALGISLLMTIVVHHTDYLKLPPQLEPLRRAQGWPDFAAHVQQARLQHGATLLLGKHYSQASMMSFYLPDQPRTYLAKQAYGKSQFSLWPTYDLSTNSRALFVTDSLIPVPKAITNDFPDCQLVDDFWSQHHGRPMTRFRIFLCKRD